jgi:hypothetical protein
MNSFTVSENVNRKDLSLRSATASFDRFATFQSLATNVFNPPKPCGAALSRDILMWYHMSGERGVA